MYLYNKILNWLTRAIKYLLGRQHVKICLDHPSFCMPNVMACVNLLTKTIYLSNHPRITKHIEQALTHEYIHLTLYELCDLYTSKQLDNIVNQIQV